MILLFTAPMSFFAHFTTSFLLFITPVGKQGGAPQAAQGKAEGQGGAGQGRAREKEAYSAAVSLCPCSSHFMNEWRRLRWGTGERLSDDDLKVMIIHNIFFVYFCTGTLVAMVLGVWEMGNCTLYMCMLVFPGRGVILHALGMCTLILLPRCLLLSFQQLICNSVAVEDEFMMVFPHISIYIYIYMFK